MSYNNRTQPPQLFIALGAVATFTLLVSSVFITPFEIVWLKIGGIGVVLLALLFMFAPFYYLKKYGQAENSVIYTTQVVDRGVYAIVRHPQYVGYMLLNGGLALLNWHWATAVAAALAIIFFSVQSIQEEKYCHQQMGDAYKAYSRYVPRFNFLLGVLKWFSRKRAA
jgi:protein-S-isoprenylcysteine O-methyltransferase Ste14